MFWDFLRARADGFTVLDLQHPQQRKMYSLFASIEKPVSTKCQHVNLVRKKRPGERLLPLTLQ